MEMSAKRANMGGTDWYARSAISLLFNDMFPVYTKANGTIQLVFQFSFIYLVSVNNR